MIMAHATTILPAVLRIPLPYRPAFWVPIALLQVALIVRVWVGDGLGMPVAWQIGGVLGVAALLLFLLTAVTSAILGPPERQGAGARASQHPHTTHETQEISRNAGGLGLKAPADRAISSIPVEQKDAE